MSRWLTFLLSSHKIAVASLDARGSAAAGDKLRFALYRKLASVEVEDQIIGARSVTVIPWPIK